MLALAALFAAPAAAIGQLCNPGLTPATPKNVRVKNNVYNGKNAEVVVEWDNPTTENTGCVQQFRVETTSMKAWQTIDNPIQSPVSYKFLLNPGQKVDFKVAAYNTKADKYSGYASLAGGVTGAPAPSSGVSTGPAQTCSKSLTPPTPTNLRVKSNVYNPSSKRSEILLEWSKTTNPNVGCVQMFTIQSITSGGGMKDNKMVDNPGQTTFTHQRLLNPGQQAKYEVWAVGFDGKVSSKAVVSSVVGAGTGATPY